MYKTCKYMHKKLWVYSICLYFSLGLSVFSVVEARFVDFRLRAGIVPGLLTDRGNSFIVSCLFDKPVQSLGKLPSSSDLFEIPTYLAGELAYTLINQVSLFGEVMWRHAKSKPFSQTFNTPTNQFSFDVRSSPANSVASYIGIRLYSSCENKGPYVGIKMGLLHNSSINGKIFLNGEKIVQADTFLKNNVVSAGLQAGIDTLLASCLKLIIQVELVANGAPKNNRNIRIDSTNFQLNSINVASVGTDLMLPISIGLSYDF